MSLEGPIMTGEQFKDNLLIILEIEHCDLYKKGLNQLNEFQDSFISIDHNKDNSNWRNYYRENCRIVTLLENEPIYKRNGNYYSNKVILSKAYKIKEILDIYEYKYKTKEERNYWITKKHIKNLYRSKLPFNGFNRYFLDGLCSMGFYTVCLVPDIAVSITDLNPYVLSVIPKFIYKFCKNLCKMIIGADKLAINLLNGVVYITFKGIMYVENKITPV